jgi:hypothetical protein
MLRQHLRAVQSRSRFGLAALLVVACVAVFGAAASGARASATSDIYNDVDSPQSGSFFGCAEFVDWSGTFHIRYHIVTDNTGGLHVQQFVANAEDVSGIGETSGATYRFVGVQGAGSFTLTQTSGASEITGVTRVRMVGPGPANNTFLDIHVHVTLAATGEITVSFFDFALSCSNG